MDLSPENSDAKPTFELSFATMNVLTLSQKDDKGKSKEVGLAICGRTAALMKQCKFEGLDVIGVQESRTSGPSYRKSGSYHVMSSGCTKNRSLGC